MKRDRLPFVIHLVVAVSFMVMLILQPVLIDTAHMDDTVLLANLGWRGVHGLRAVIDYPHFYGGVIAQFVTWAFQLFGAAYHTINYAFAMIGVAAVATLWALGWQRLSPRGLALLTALSSSLLLSLVPIEFGYINRPTIAHSYIYNHAAIVLMMALTIFSLKMTESGRVEIATAFLAGFLIYVLALLKPTFGVFGPCVVLACLLQARWLSTALVVLGAGAGMLIMDPGMVRFFESLSYLLGSAAAEGAGPSYFFFRIVGIVSAQTWAIALVGLMIMSCGKHCIKLLSPILVLMCGYGAAILRMNSKPDLILLPILTVIALKCCDTTTDDGKDHGLCAISPLKLVPTIFAFLIIFPAFVSAIAALGISVINRAEFLISEGPGKGYAVISLSDLKPSAETTALANRANDVLRDLSEMATEKEEYTIFADGIDLLQSIPEMKNYGIISNGRQFDFTMPIGSPPVLSFPVWPTANLPYFKDPSPLPTDVDAVMISIVWPRSGLINRELIAKMGEEFRICSRSSFWTLHVRRNIPEDLCNLTK